MIKLVIFDLDGVLVDSRDLHYEALNAALFEIDTCYVINREEHLSSYDGLPTSEKLKMLTIDKNLPEDLYETIWKLKQKKTTELISLFEVDERIVEILKILKERNYTIACATNSIRETAKLQLIKKGFFEHIDFLYSNTDVEKPKPDAEIYMRCMLRAKANPDETLIIEDSYYGRMGALRSGGYLLPVKNSSDVTFQKIINRINEVEKRNTKIEMGSDITILIPMAGAGSRFSDAGYKLPKPLIKVDEKPMIQIVVENLPKGHHIFLVQKEHEEKHNIKYLLRLLDPNCEIIIVEGLTDGAACTALLAKDLINNDKPLLIANSDQFLEWNDEEFMYAMEEEKIDGGIVTFTATDQKWSYAKIDEKGVVTEVAEKNPISNIATVGVYYWKKGSDFVKYAEQMISLGIKTQGEFYICPVYNEAIQDGKKITTYQVEKMWGLGTPEDLEKFNACYRE